MNTQLKSIAEEQDIGEVKRIGGIDKDEYVATMVPIAKEAGIDMLTAVRKPTQMNRLCKEFTYRQVCQKKTSAKTVKKAQK